MAATHTERTGDAPRVLRVGIIGCGEVSQTVHVPTLGFLSQLYKITYLCDVSPQALSHSAAKITPTPRTTADAEQLCSSAEVDVVLIANANAYHVEHGILALKHDKHCLIEKPLALSFRDVDRIVEAEKTSKGKVFVGTMRRFAAAFVEAVGEVGGMERVLYARVRDIIGPNSTFVGQSGTFPLKFSDVREVDVEDRERRDEEIAKQALGEEFEVPVTPESKRMLQLLGG